MDKQPVYIIGAGGHARALAALVTACKTYSIAGFFDNHLIPGEKIGGIPVLGTLSQLPAEGKLMLAAGDNLQRKKLFEQYHNRIVGENVVHDSVILLGGADLGHSNFVFPRVVINTEVKIGDNNIINTGAIVEHETVIGSHNHISLGVILAGRVKIGNHCLVGASSVIKDGISICDGVTIGAGAIVVKHIVEPGTYVGVPAKRIK